MSLLFNIKLSLSLQNPQLRFHNQSLVFSSSLVSTTAASLSGSLEWIKWLFQAVLKIWTCRNLYFIPDFTFDTWEVDLPIFRDPDVALCARLSGVLTWRRCLPLESPRAWPRSDSFWISSPPRLPHLDRRAVCGFSNPGRKSLIRQVSPGDKRWK